MEEGRLAGLAAAEALGYASEDTRRRKAEALRTLEELRAGPFGEGRRKAREALIQGYRACVAARASRQ
jgi:hypothetical protein